MTKLQNTGIEDEIWSSFQ